MQRIILHLDMNSYFASVEQQANPFLRNRPVGVCSYLSSGGCVIASSREAKEKGVKTGCRVRDAKRLAPGIILLENEPAKYRSCTKRIFSILSQYTDRLEPYSIDEAFLDLSGWAKSRTEAGKKAKEMRRRIKSEIGSWLDCSIGLSWTKFLAKFAGDIAPKGGTLEIRPGNLEPLLNGRPLQDAWGINQRMERRLNALGIKNLLELKRCDPARIKNALGRCGYYLWAGVNGREITEIKRGSPAPKSVGHSYCLPQKTPDKTYLRPILFKLCEKTGRRLRGLGQEAGRMSLAIAYAREGGLYKTWKTPQRVYTTREIADEALAFLEKCDLAAPVRMMAVAVSGLAPLSKQLSFFQDAIARQDLSQAIDRINDKYGEFTLIHGEMFGTKGMAKDRIGFRKTGLQDF